MDLAKTVAVVEAAELAAGPAAVALWGAEEQLQASEVLAGDSSRLSLWREWPALVRDTVALDPRLDFSAEVFPWAAPKEHQQTELDQDYYPEEGTG